MSNVHLTLTAASQGKYKIDRLSQNNVGNDKLYCLRFTDFEVKKMFYRMVENRFEEGSFRTRCVLKSCRACSRKGCTPDGVLSCIKRQNR